MISQIPFKFYRNVTVKSKKIVQTWVKLGYVDCITWIKQKIEWNVLKQANNTALLFERPS